MNAFKSWPWGAALKSPSVHSLSFLFRSSPAQRLQQDLGAASRMEDQGVFVLIPTILGLILLRALLGLLAEKDRSKTEGEWSQAQ